MFAEHALEVSWTKDQVEEYIKTIDPSIMEDVNTKYSKESELKRKYIAVATVMRNNFFNAYPELATRIEREEAFARRKGYCTSAFGSTRNFIELKECGTYDNKYNTNEEIYNIFDTGKFLNRPPLVAVSNTSGLAGIAHWINSYYGLKEEKQVDKNSVLVVELKKWVDAEYESGRVTVLTDDELIREINHICEEKGITI